MIKRNPDVVFGNGNSQVMFNTRDGGAPGTEIDMHDDEPIVLGEANMDDSSESGSDGEETPEDKKAYLENLKRAENSNLQKKRRRVKNR